MLETLKDESKPEAKLRKNLKWFFANFGVEYDKDGRKDFEIPDFKGKIN